MPSLDSNSSGAAARTGAQKPAIANRLDDSVANIARRMDIIREAFYSLTVDELEVWRGDLEFL